MFASMIRTFVATVALAAVASAASPSFAQDIKIAQTAAEHEAKAKVYKEQATQYRKDAAEHKEMAAAYAKQHRDIKGLGKNPAAQKVSKHCLALAKDYEKLATDSEKMAEYHEMRAKELQGG